MNGPSEELRSQIRSRIDEIAVTLPNEPRNVTPQIEDRLAGILNDISIALGNDAVGGDDDPQNLLDATNEWAGLLSYAVSRVYAPASPWPIGLGGWGRAPVKALQRGAGQLQTPLTQAATALRANGFSVSVGFPWGVSVGLSWPIPPVSPENSAITVSTQIPATDSTHTGEHQDHTADRRRQMKEQMPEKFNIPDGSER